MNDRLKSFLKELEYVKDCIPPDAFTDLVKKATALVEREDRLLTASEVAKKLGVSRTTIWRWSKNKLLPTYQLPGGQVRIRESDLEDFIEKHRLMTEGLDKPKPIIVGEDRNRNFFAILASAAKQCQ